MQFDKFPMSPNGLPRQWRALGVVPLANVAFGIGCSNEDNIRNRGAAESDGYLSSWSAGCRVKDVTCDGVD
jgi:hypothetical protein